MKTDHLPPEKTSRIILTKELKLRLLNALRAGLIDMAHFPELVEAGHKIKVDMSQLSDEDVEDALRISRKLQYV